MKLRTCAGLLTLFLIISATNSNAAIGDKKKPKKEMVAMTSEQKAARLTEIKNRVNEIRAMDISTLSKEDRKTLKKELRELKKEARSGSGGIYLSTGAIIIILLVLILIL